MNKQSQMKNIIFIVSFLLLYIPGINSQVKQVTYYTSADLSLGSGTGADLGDAKTRNYGGCASLMITNYDDNYDYMSSFESWVRFDLGTLQDTIPEGESLLCAELKYKVTNNTGNGFHCFHLKDIDDWQEGNGTAGTLDDAGGLTWNDAQAFDYENPDNYNHVFSDTIVGGTNYPGTFNITDAVKYELGADGNKLLTLRFFPTITDPYMDTKWLGFYAREAPWGIVLPDGVNEAASHIVFYIGPDQPTEFSDFDGFGDIENYRITPEGFQKWAVYEDEGDDRLVIMERPPPINGTPGGLAILKNAIYSDFDIKVKVKLNKEKSGGLDPKADFIIVFGYYDALNYSYFRFTGEDINGIYQVNNSDGISQEVVGELNMEPAIPDMLYHEYRLVKISDTVTAYIDGIFYMSVIDEKLNVEGQIGMGSYNDIVFFDDFKEWKNPTPFNGLSLNATNVSCFGESDGEIDLKAGYGQEPYTFLWSTGETTEDISSLSPGKYIVEVTDANDSVVMDSAWITQPEILTTNIYRHDSISNHGFTDGIAAAKASGGTAPYYFVWDDPAVTKDSVVYSLPGEAEYHLIVEDQNGCLAYDSIYIEGSDRLFVEIIQEKDTLCFNEPVGPARAKAHFADYPVTYLWDDPGNTIDSVLSGIDPWVYYRIQLTDASGRVGSDSIIFAQTDSITVDSLFINPVTGCFGDENGSIIILANMPYPSTVIFSIDSGKTFVEWGSFPDLAGGYYQVLIQDTNECILPVDSILVEQPARINPIIEVTDEISCFGLCDASLSVSEEAGVPPFTYLWSTEETSSVLNDLCPGEYLVKVTDDDGCIDSGSIVVGEPPPLTIESNYPAELCSGTPGPVVLEVAGGMSPYQIKIFPGDTLIPLELNLPPGEYIMVVTDSNGCEEDDTVMINNIMPYPDPQICVVTVDTVTERNLIVWDKVPNQFITSYNIYRETIMADQYELIGNVHYNEQNTFLDTTTNPEIHSVRYKISIVDSCGNESDLSPFQKSPFLQVSFGIEGTINLMWEGYSGDEENLYEYFEIYKTHCSIIYPLNLINIVPPTIHLYTDSDTISRYRIFSFRIAGVLADACNVSDSSGHVITYDRAFSQPDMNVFCCEVCDVTPPSVPQHLSVYTVGEFLVLKWDRSNDLTGIEKYNIYDDGGEFLESTADSFFIFTDYPLDSIHTFSVTAVDWNYNESEKSEPVTYSNVGWSNNSSDELNVYPNPFTSGTTIVFSNQNKENYILVIRDLTGKVLRQISDIQDGKIYVNRGNLPAGLYLIELRGPEVHRCKIIIE